MKAAALLCVLLALGAGSVAGMKVLETSEGPSMWATSLGERSTRRQEFL